MTETFSEDKRKIPRTNLVVTAYWSKEETPQLEKVKIKNSAFTACNEVTIQAKDLKFLKNIFGSILQDSVVQQSTKERKEREK